MIMEEIFLLRRVHPGAGKGGSEREGYVLGNYSCDEWRWSDMKREGISKEETGERLVFELENLRLSLSLFFRGHLLSRFPLLPL